MSQITNEALLAYLMSMPIDPTGGTTYTSVKTGYSVVVDTNNIVTIRACGGETVSGVAATINVSR